MHADATDIVRAFNRFYTQRIGVLEDGYLDSPYTLAQARVLYELAHREEPTAAEIGRDLGLDPGYLSRILRGFERSGLISRRRSVADGRQRLLTLTGQGRDAFAPLDLASRQQAATMLDTLSCDERIRLVGAMRAIAGTLGDRELPQPPYALRPHQPGDMGWVVQRHGAIYAEEYGWDPSFEALVAGIVADFLTTFDAERERCWIAERDGERLGSIFLVKHPEREGVAKLRLLLVEPSARGLGLGRRLVEECTRFAREAGYHTITLWTNSVLLAARHLYEAAGYRLVHAEPHSSFGHDLISETWELDVGDR